MADKNSPQVFNLFGYAGTGKTTLAQELAATAQKPLFCAFTGKAASVLQSKGCSNATTIHQAIYRSSAKSSANYERLTNKLRSVCPKENPEDHKKISNQLEQEKQRLDRPSFMINPEAEAKYCDFIIVDECSMVDNKIGEDLASFEKKILALGDPAQLPPVFGSGYFDNSPDFTLTEIHRQAKGNPIIELATDIRQGKGIKIGQYGESSVFSGQVPQEMSKEVDQVIVGKNKTRRAANARIRELRHGIKKGSHPFPTKGERVICLKNNYEKGLLNGAIFTVSEDAKEIDNDSILLVVTNEQGQEIETITHKCHFIENDSKLPYWLKLGFDEFDFGYAITCHKAQGSQWDEVLILNESQIFGKDANKWLYTAVTRAAKKVIIKI